MVLLDNDSANVGGRRVSVMRSSFLGVRLEPVDDFRVRPGHDQGREISARLSARGAVCDRQVLPLRRGFFPNASQPTKINLLIRLLACHLQFHVVLSVASKDDFSSDTVAQASSIASNAFPRSSAASDIPSTFMIFTVPSIISITLRKSLS